MSDEHEKKYSERRVPGYISIIPRVPFLRSQGYWYVVSSYSHTDRRFLLQVHSRRFSRREDAEFHRDVCRDISQQTRSGRKKRFGIVFQEISEEVLP